MLFTLGYGGDGDEVAAIEEVEGVFGIRFDQSDADGCRSVGDVFASLLRRLDLSADEGAALWPQFAHAIAAENGHDGAEVDAGTLLLEPYRAPLRVLLRNMWRAWRRRP